jgi:RNA polymerase sigma-70 factor (ECF subfamily)
MAGAERMAKSKDQAVAEAFEPARVEEHRAYLMRYAMLRLRDATAAEDAVQETLLAALQTGTRFAGRSSVRTWLTGILKHKIVDYVRRQSREQPLEGPDEEVGDAATDVAGAAFAPDGHWHDFPADWGAPDASFESAQFWKVFEACVQVMPARAARVFVMREVLELATEDICKELGITATNCWVLLHRARLSLRECLETKWFKP